MGANASEPAGAKPLGSRAWHRVGLASEATHASPRERRGAVGSPPVSAQGSPQGRSPSDQKMTKAELVEEVSRASDLTKKHSEVIVDTVFKSIVDALHRGEKIELRGFGSFRLRRREPRKGRNPKTGDKVDVPPKKVPYFKPGKELKDLINQSTGS